MQPRALFAGQAIVALYVFPAGYRAVSCNLFAMVTNGFVQAASFD